MIELSALFSIFIIHWFADFVLQTHEQAINKSSNNIKLLEHTLTYTLFWLFIGICYIAFNFDRTAPLRLITFAGITFAAHTITDWFTSRWCKYYFSRQNYHNGFVVVGIDQMLHYTQLILCYIWLS
jgi:hypothetical protein